MDLQNKKVSNGEVKAGNATFQNESFINARLCSKNKILGRRFVGGTAVFKYECLTV